MDLSRLLAPRSVIIVGATDRPASYGGQTARNLISAGFDGPLMGVNPTRTEVHGIPCVPTLAEAVTGLGTPPDAVVVATPAAGVPGLVDEAGKLGAGGVVVYAAGFAEAPGEDRGGSLQAELVAAAARHSLPVIGPNGNGLVAVHSKAPLWGDAVTLRRPGGIALITQSGNIGVNALSLASGPNFHTVVSGGNQAVVDAARLLDHLAGVDGVRVAALYLESDGDGAHLAEALARCNDNGVRIVVLKGGRTEAGRAAGAAHTASLAGDTKVFRALMDEAGAIVVTDLSELLAVAQVLDRPPLKRRQGASSVAVVTCSGGDCTMAADLAGDLAIPLATLVPDTRQRLRAALPPTATVVNPLDHTNAVFGDADAVADIVQAMASDPEVGVVLALQDQPIDLPDDAAQQWRDTLVGDVRGAAAADVPMVIASTLPEHRPDRDDALGGLRAGLVAAHALVATTPADGTRLRAVAAAAARALPSRDHAQMAPGDGPSAHDHEGFGGGGGMSEGEAKELLAGVGVPVPRHRVVGTPEEALEAFAALGAPRVVVKAEHPALVHKSDIGAVVLDLTDGEAVRAAAQRVLAAAPAGARVLLEEQADAGLEVVVAAHRLGVVPVVVVGLGGLWAEVLDDVAVIPLPADAARVTAALLSLRAAPVLTGSRGGQPYAIDALARLAAAVGGLLLDRDLTLVEINPVIVGRGPAGGAVAVDAVITARPGPDPAHPQVL